jgi:hypothetical protein
VVITAGDYFEKFGQKKQGQKQPTKMGIYLRLSVKVMG